MAMENGRLEDVFPIENGDIHCYVSLPEGTLLQDILKQELLAGVRADAHESRWSPAH